MLYFTVGPARCGKSTFCDKYIQKSPNTAVVSGDDIRASLHGLRYSSFAEGMCYAIKSIMIRSLLRRGMDVIVDGTHTTRESVLRILEIDPKAFAVMFDTPVEVCKQRAIDTNQPDLVGVIERHARNLREINEKYGGYSEFMASILAELKVRWKDSKLPNITKEL